MKNTDAVFRDVALRRLSVPDELTEVLSVTRPVDWLMLCALGLLLAAGLGWATFTTLEVTVAADRVVYDRSDGRRAALFVADTEVRQIRPGMTVWLQARGGAGQNRRPIGGSVVRVLPGSAAGSRVDVVLNSVEELQTSSSIESEPKAYIVLRRERPINALLPLLNGWRGPRG